MFAVPLVTAALLVTLGGASMAAATPWAGRYGFEEVQPGMFWTTTLEIAPDGRRAFLMADGYQTLWRLDCDVAVQGDSAAVRFRASRPGTPPAHFKRGERLFTLVRTRHGIITRWGAMTPNLVANERRRVGFARKP